MRTPKIHELKTWPEHFESVHRGAKPFEVRKDDRGFKVDDWLHLREWQKDPEGYTGRDLWVKVGYILRGYQEGIVLGHCVMAVKVLRVYEITDCVWWVGFDSHVTLDVYMDETGTDREEATGEVDGLPRGLTQKELTDLRFILDEDKPGYEVSFRQQLGNVARNIVSGVQRTPSFFAGSEV